MGLFDGYFDPQQFGSDGGGLLSRLLTLAQQQAQYQPGAGFGLADNGPPPSPPQTLAPLPMPRPTMLPDGSTSLNPQALDHGSMQDIRIGDYQMPQFGGADPSQAAQPPNFRGRFSAGLQSWAHTPVGNPIAALANGVGGLSSGQPTDAAGVTPTQNQAPVGSPGIGDRLSASLQSWAHTPVGDPFAALANAISGLSTGQRVADTVNAPQSLSARLELLKSLLDDRDAMLATIDPQGGAPLVAQALSRRAAAAIPPAGATRRAQPGQPNPTAGLEAEMRKRGLMK
jgi:hypothetical protein